MRGRKGGPSLINLGERVLKKKIVIASPIATNFVRDLVRAVQAGATIPEDHVAYKGMVLRTQLEADEDVIIEPSPSVTIIPVEQKDRDKKAKKAQKASKRASKATKAKGGKKARVKTEKPSEAPVEPLETVPSAEEASVEEKQDKEG